MAGGRAWSALLGAHGKQIQKRPGLGYPPRKIRPFPGTLQDPAQFILTREEEAAITCLVDIQLEKHHTRLGRAQGPWKILLILSAPAGQSLSYCVTCIISFNSLEQPYTVGIFNSHFTDKETEVPRYHVICSNSTKPTSIKFG